MNLRTTRRGRRARPSRPPARRPGQGLALAVLLAWTAGCAQKGDAATPRGEWISPRAPPASAMPFAAPDPPPPPQDSAAVGGRPSSAKTGRPGLTQAAARRYMVDLINRDRASEGLGPVTLDEGAATTAGQVHANDMAKNGYLGHWGTDGSVPEQRFTEAGGVDMVLENASCFTDEKPRTLDGAPGIDPKNIELAESMFFHETPPHDGHRRNILKAWHVRVGIGVAQPVATPVEIPAPCFAQEFVDAYGTYVSLPAAGQVGAVLHVEGKLRSPAKFAGVGLARVDPPRPLPVSELNRRRSYPVPTPYAMYWPPGFQTPIPVRTEDNHFAVDVPLSDRGRAGLYEVSVWASVPGSDDLVMVSLRTIRTSPARPAR